MSLAEKMMEQEEFNEIIRLSRIGMAREIELIEKKCIYVPLEIRERPLWELPCSARTANGIKDYFGEQWSRSSIGDLHMLPIASLYRIRRIGKKSIADLRDSIRVLAATKANEGM